MLAYDLECKYLCLEHGISQVARTFCLLGLYIRGIFIAQSYFTASFSILYKTVF